ncbi:hypothetical protein D9613_010230 [Agrocybe pediades]|uniref:Uncharacterized protein n=1 Tax=Agrocybe pediades TaxID=84607 RepID=A0A8H4QG28_9AGAR|nr:hypothetical protein D9613_010230 [Agrocybe pediades]
MAVFTTNCAAHSGDRYGGLLFMQTACSSASTTGLVLTVITYQCLLHAKPDFGTDQTGITDRLSAAANVAAVATSLVSTVVICLQISQHTTLSSRSKKRYQTIIKALIESSASYTVTVLFAAILNFADTGSIEQSFEVSVISDFSATLTQIISGMAPTLMIARLFVSSHQEHTDLSSACLPSELMSCIFNAASASPTNVGVDLEMQQSGFIETGKQESEEIQVVPRNEYHVQPEDELQDRGHNVV